MIVQRINKARAYLGAEGLGPFLVRAVAGTGLVRMAAMLASFALGVQLARMLGVEAYGYYGLALSIITIAGIPGELGIPILVTRESAVATSNREPHLIFAVLHWARCAILRLSVLAGLVCLAALFLTATTRPSVLVLTILLGAPIVPLMALARTDSAVLQGMGYIVRGQIPVNLLRPTFASVMLVFVYLLHLHVDAEWAMFVNSVSAGLTLVVAHVLLSGRLPPRPIRSTADQHRKWLATSIPMAMTDGIRIIQLELTIVLLGLITSPTAVGYFRIATATATMAAIANQIVAQVAISILARLHADRDHKRLQYAVTALARTQLAGVSLLALPLMVAPTFFIGTIFGEPYVLAANPLRILLAGHLVNAAFGPNATLLNMAHQERRLTRAIAIATCVGLFLVAILPTVLGATGAAIGIVVWMSLLNVLTWLDARKYLNIETSVFRMPEF